MCPCSPSACSALPYLRSPLAPSVVGQSKQTYHSATWRNVHLGFKVQGLPQPYHPNKFYRCVYASALTKQVVYQNAPPISKTIMPKPPLHAQAAADNTTYPQHHRPVKPQTLHHPGSSMNRDILLASGSRVHGVSIREHPTPKSKPNPCNCEFWPSSITRHPKCQDPEALREPVYVLAPSYLRI